MRIVFLSFYNGALDRGVEVATKALARHLGKNHEITLFQAGRKIESDIKTELIEVESKWPTDTSSSFLRRVYLDYYSIKIILFTIKSLQRLSKDSPDVIIPTNGGWQMLLVKIFSKIKKVKLVVQGNAGIGADDHWQLLFKPDYYIAISPAGLAWAQNIAPQVTMSYIPYGVNLADFKNAVVPQLALKSPIVLCVGAFSAYKRIDLLIKAMAKVPEASLLVIGHGPRQEYLQNLGQKLLGSRFLLKTGISHEQLLGYYKRARVFSLPSAESEAFGIVYIEAMAANLPVVAPRDDNKKAILGDAGVLVDVTDMDAYANAIKMALEKDFDQKPRKQAEKFSWKKIAQQYENILKNL